MKNAAQLLIRPFQEVLESMTVHANSWSGMLESLRFLPAHAARLGLINYLLTSSPELSDFPSTLKKLVDDVEGPASKAQFVITDGLESIFYSAFVGGWALLEASFEDLIVRILCNEPSASALLQKRGIGLDNKLEVGSEEWARKMFKKMEGKFGQKNSPKNSTENEKKSIVETHKEILAVFDAPLSFSLEDSAKMEEMNGIRNCILHRNGCIDKKAVKSSSRLELYYGRRVPIDDPIFTQFPLLLFNYTAALLFAVVQSQYLCADPA